VGSNPTSSATSLSELIAELRASQVEEMSMRTPLTSRFDLTVPVVGAPMAGAAGGRLAAAISASGGLGMIGAGGAATPAWIAEQARIAAAGGRAWGVGLLAWVVEANPAQLAAVAELAPPLVSVSFGPYQRHLETLKRAGCAVATQVGTVAEALAAERAGVDLIVARGGEGGGHGRNDVATLPLLQAVLDRVSVPVLAAGGIGTPRGLAAVLAAGAAGAWVGTAFLACQEATVVAAARERIVAADQTDTSYGRVFDVGLRQAWPPEYGGRALRNAFFERWQGRELELATDEGAHAELLAALDSHDFDTGCIYAGQGVGLIQGSRSAAEVVADLASAADLLRRAAAGIVGGA
jgi:nitronate monooxygenase